MPQPALHGQHILFAEVLQGDGHLKAPVCTDLHRVKPRGFLSRLDQSGTGIIFICQLVSQHGHTRKAVRGMGVDLQRLHIRLNCLNVALQLFYLLREVPQQIIFQPVLLALVVGFHNFQLGSLFTRK